jgi:molybdopterin-guanine dinucleotide biosynthesis protein A
VYHQRVNDVTAFMLAGGRSTRMGHDKALLKLGERTLLERAWRLAKSVTENVRLAGDFARCGMYEPVVQDIYPERGPLGGIHAALLETKTELNLIIAVDIPFVEKRFLDFLITEARRDPSVVTVPRAGGYMHPLCAIYRREFGMVSEKALIRGQNRIDILFAGIQARVIEEEEMLQRRFSMEMFRNVNTPEEWEKAQLWARENEEKAEIHSESRHP